MGELFWTETKENFLSELNSNQDLTEANVKNQDQPENAYKQTLDESKYFVFA